VRQEPRQALRKNPERSENNPEEVLQVTRQIQKEPGLIRKQPGWGTYKFRKNPERSENNPEEVLQVTRQIQKEPGLIRKQPGWGTYKFRKNLDEVQTTWKRYIKNQRSPETTWMNKKQLGRVSRLSQTLSSGARHSLQLRPGARIQGRKTKNTSTQDYNNDNTSRPFIRFLF